MYTADISRDWRWIMAVAVLNLENPLRLSGRRAMNRFMYSSLWSMPYFFPREWSWDWKFPLNSRTWPRIDAGGGMRQVFLPLSCQDCCDADILNTHKSSWKWASLVVSSSLRTKLWTLESAVVSCSGIPCKHDTTMCWQIHVYRLKKMPRMRISRPLGAFRSPMVTSDRNFGSAPWSPN